MAKRSAGVLLFRATKDAPQVLLVHPGGPLWSRKDLGSWSIPKGEYEEAEDPKAAAIREFEEETGLRLPEESLVPLGEVRQKSGKVVIAWTTEGDFDVSALRSNLFDLEWPPKSGRTQQFPEVDRAQWFGLDTAQEKINAAQAEFLRRLRGVLREQGRTE